MIIIKSNKPIEGKGVLQKVAEYATSSSGLSEEIPSIETIINMDFFNQNADIKIRWIDGKNAIVKIKQKN